MWNLGVEKFLDLFPNNGRIKVIGFADDGALMEPQNFKAIANCITINLLNFMR